MRLPDWLNDLIDRAYSDRKLSWFWHGVQGLAFGFVGAWLGLALGGTGAAGLVFVGGAFGHREADNALEPLRKEGLGAAWRSVSRDGFADLLSPYVGAVAGTALALVLR